MFLVDEIQLGKIYAIVLTSIVGFLMIIILMSLSVQPKSNAVLSFMVITDICFILFMKRVIFKYYTLPSLYDCRFHLCL